MDKLNIPLAILLLLGLLASVTSSSHSPTHSQQDEEVSTYIVHVSHNMKPSAFVTHTQWYAQTLSSVKGLSLPTSQEAGAAGANIVAPAEPGILYVYQNVFNGFAATMTAKQAKSLTTVPGFQSSMVDGTSQLHTTRTPEFLGLNSGNPSDTGSGATGLWQSSHFGENVIVGVLDTGIWPERPSYDDAGMNPVPARWKGACEVSSSFGSNLCNRKIIGARAFYKGYENLHGPINDTADFKSPRDGEGHGTHTSSTVGGRIVGNASLFGYAAGQASGMAPLARLAIYKVCWAGGCFNSDILAAFDAAVGDGVDIISLSVGGPAAPHYSDPIAIGAFGAMMKGIVTSASAGNSGPSPLSVANVAPWVMTVAASTLDRNFPAPVTIGDGTKYSGVSLFSGNASVNQQTLELVYAGDVYMGGGKNLTEAGLCLVDSLNASLVAGKMVLCDRGISARSAKASVVQKAGGAAMILANTRANGEELAADSFLAPGTLVGFQAGEAIKSYIKSTPSPTAEITFQGTIVDVKPSPMMAAFSSRGPNPVVPEILKPDLTAPGVNILAAWTGKIGPSGQPADTRVVNFNIISGTSMSCPHVSGLAALLKGAKPEWSPSAIKSALMTTSTIVDNKGGALQDGSDGSVSTPFAHGAGHVVPQAAMNPGLIYDIDIQNYVDYLCGLGYSPLQLEMFTKGQYNCSVTNGTKAGDLNYPSFSLVYLQESSATFSATYSRTVQNVGGASAMYKVEVTEPEGVKITVDPTILEFKEANQKLTYKVTFKALPVMSNGSYKASFGRLAWKDGTHVVQSPISFLWLTTM